MKKILLAVLSLSLCATPTMAQDAFWTLNPDGQGFLGAVNIAAKFDGKKVADANGFFGTTWAIITEIPLSVGRTVADTAAEVAEHPVKTTIWTIVGLAAYDLTRGQDDSEIIKAWNDLTGAGDDPPADDAQFKIAQLGDGEIDVTYNGDLEDVDIYQTGGGTITIHPPVEEESEK